VKDDGDGFVETKGLEYLSEDMILLNWDFT
jgi:hypothetical protein